MQNKEQEEPRCKDTAGLPRLADQKRGWMIDQTAAQRGYT